MQDITMYSDDELSLMVFNDEGWYNMRSDYWNLLECLESCYTFTEAQKDVLIQDIKDDIGE